MVVSQPNKTNNDSLVIEHSGAKIKLLFAPQTNTEIADQVIELLTNSFVELLCSKKKL